MKTPFRYFLKYVKHIKVKKMKELKLILVINCIYRNFFSLYNSTSNTYTVCKRYWK